MIHYSCDRCGRELDPKMELRYVVEMDIRAKMESCVMEDPSEDADPLEELEQILDVAEAIENELIGEDVCRRLRFDLCPECHRHFVENPVGGERIAELTFSKN